MGRSVVVDPVVAPATSIVDVQSSMASLPASAAGIYTTHAEVGDGGRGPGGRYTPGAAPRQGVASMQRDEGERRVQTVCLVVLATFAVGAALRWLAPVMIPFVLAVFFAFILSPLIELQVARLRMPRAAAISVTLVLAFLLFAGVAALVSASVRQLAANADGYQAKATALVNMAASTLSLERFGIDAAAVSDPLKKFSVGALGKLLLGTTNAILDILSNGFLVLVFMVFLLLGASGRPPDPDSTWSEIDARIKRYLVTKGVLSAATGALVGSALSLLGIDLALVFGLFAFLLELHPEHRLHHRHLPAAARGHRQPGRLDGRRRARHRDPGRHPVLHRQHHRAEGHGRIARPAPGGDPAEPDHLGNAVGHRRHAAVDADPGRDQDPVREVRGHPAAGRRCWRAVDLRA